jgi:type I restriction enzyme M protein
MSDNNKIETTLWKTADKLRNKMDAAEYKNMVPGLIFLKYISDSFEELYNKLKSDCISTGADPEDGRIGFYIYCSALNKPLKKL